MGLKHGTAPPTLSLHSASSSPCGLLPSTQSQTLDTYYYYMHCNRWYNKKLSFVEKDLVELNSLVATFLLLLSNKLSDFGWPTIEITVCACEHDIKGEIAFDE